MRPFNPKEYKRYLVVFTLSKTLHPPGIPSGAKVNDKTGFLQVLYGREKVGLLSQHGRGEIKKKVCKSNQEMAKVAGQVSLRVTRRE
jgi:hypothetical protein